ncbi:hypothetical protein SSX86_007725 [Deinandra increscens subsp. villosa]|uniref:Sialate O-acetylesterase domain-containing protein n=1 Tax=Deinandra increscens subsp. villosa TaxID=3103831 RepID=A0AAP0DF78_9ASTR
MLPLFISYTYLLLSTAVQIGNAAAGKINIFILAGQSNMSGRGGVVNLTWDGYIPPESSSNPSILRLTANLSWVPAAEPLHRDIDVAKVCGVGPGMSFANSLLRKDSRRFGVVGLVPCAIGGTNISEWVRGGDLYEQMMRRAKAAVHGGGVIQGLLWYQGESDTVSLEDAECYKNRLHRFFVDVRADLHLPLLPVIQVALASGSGSYIDIVREAQLGTKLENLRTVDAKGMSLQDPERLHLTTPAQVSLGKMLSKAFLQTSNPLSS